MKKVYMTPATEVLKIASENLICVSGGGSLSISSGGGTGSGGIGGGDIKMEQEFSDAVDDLMFL